MAFMAGFLIIPAVGLMSANDISAYTTQDIAGSRIQVPASAAADSLPAIEATVEEEIILDVVTETANTPYETKTVEDASIYKGDEEVKVDGSDGEKSRVYHVETDEDGDVVSKELTLEVVMSEPVDEVVAVGTKEKPATALVQTAPVEPGSNRAIGKQMAVDKYGWSGEQWQCLNDLWARESGWNHLAQNSSSGAYGIPQSLPGNKMASAGSDWQTNPATQISWGLSYIKSRYGSPCGAWAHSESVGWY